MSPDGSFHLDGHTGLTVAPGLSLDTFEGLPSAARASMNYHPGGVGARMDGRTILGRNVVLGLGFESGTLRRVSIFILLPSDGTSWSDWTLSQEMARKREHDALARELFGVALVPKAFEINGKQILPLELTPEHPNHALFPWGEVVSGYDSKGGMAELWIAYK